jgi:hypothetical protein
MPANCSMSECQLRSSAGYRVVVTAYMERASSSAIGATVRKFPFGCTVDTDQQIAAMLSHSYIATIHVQYGTVHRYCQHT